MPPRGFFRNKGARDVAEVTLKKDLHQKMKIHKSEGVTEISDTADYRDSICDSEAWFPRFIYRATLPKYEA